MAQQRMNVQAPIDRLFAKRWSTRAFDSDKPVTTEQLAACLEAARWAPSCFGEEPWHFIVANRFENEDGWQQILECLAPKNQLWAKSAPLLIIAAANPLFSQKGNPNRWAEYDTGQAAICLCLQAETLGLASHQMGGFDPDALKTAVGIPAQMHVMSVTALGYPADDDTVPEEFRPMEQSPRTRKPLADIVHAAHWDAAWKVPAGPGWEARYQETAVKDLPWFHAGLDADIAAALGSNELTGTSILDLGCGPGTQSVALAKRGFVVTATDISWSAVESAQQLAEAEEASIAFHVDDILESKLTGPFDVVVDRGVFHCFADEADQQAFLTTMRRLLKPDGMLLLKCFHKKETSEIGPPGRYDEDDIRHFFANGFELVETHDSHFESTLDSDPKALFCSLRKI
jgi:nitroreductase/predicted RNA methylase